MFSLGREPQEQAQNNIEKAAERRQMISLGCKPQEIAVKKEIQPRSGDR